MCYNLSAEMQEALSAGGRDMQGKVSAVAAIALVLLCVVLSVKDVAVRGRAWAEAEVTGTATPVSVLLFADDFGTYSGRWRESYSAKSTVAYRDEALWMRVVSPGVAVWSIPDFQVPMADFSIQVVVRFNAGQPDGQAGILFDYVDDEHFAAVLLSAEGRLQVLARDGEQWQELATQDEQGSSVPFGEPVLLQMDWISNEEEVSLDLTVGGDSVTEFILPTGRRGRAFGLIARAGRGYIDVSFDDVLVMAQHGGK